MSYLPFALLSYFLNSIAVTVDKFLLARTIKDPLIYVFYFSLIGFLAIFAIPFTKVPSLQVLLMASFSTLNWTLGAYLMFKALKLGMVQRVIPVIGTITPLILLILAFQTQSINNQQALAVILLIMGLIFLTINDWRGKLIKTELMLEISSAVFFALSYYFLHLAFLQTDFLAVLVWSKPILLPLGIIFLIIPALRRKILPFLTPQKNLFNKKSALIFVFGQLAAGVSELMLTFSISLANPALVNSLQGIKYVYLLIFSLILGRKFPDVFKNKFSGLFLISQIAGIGLIGFGLYLLAT